MGFFEKIKNVIFDDGDDVIIDDTKSEEEIKEVVKKSKEEPVKQVSEEKIEKKEENVFQDFNEEEFDRIAAINKRRLMERDKKAREDKEEEQRQKEERLLQEKRLNEYHNVKSEYHTSNVKDTRQTSSDKQDIYNKPLPKKEEVKKFTPSPVISPVYGVLGENYRKEDILPRASSEGTLPKVMDVDNVRKKAFGILEQSIEEEPLKDFKGEDEMTMEDMSNELEATDDIIKRSKVEEVVESATNEVEAKYNLENNNIPSREEDSLEKDLFNLIDSMYENKEEK